MSSIPFNVSPPRLFVTAFLLAATTVAAITFSTHSRQERIAVYAPSQTYSYCQVTHISTPVCPLNHDDVDIQNLEFGAYNDKGQFQPADSVPCTLHQRYGWRMKVEANEPVEWVEVLTLPSAPDTWGPPSRHRHVSSDRKTCTSRFVEYPMKGVLEDSWMVEKGDPKGVYNMCLIVNGKEVKHVQFTLE